MSCHTAQKLAIFAFALVLAACGEAAMSFDTAAWVAQKGNATGKNPRAAMVESAKLAGVKAGATREEVRRLLGAPDISDDGGDIWYLGRSLSSVDYATLHIDYDASGIVTSVRTQST